MNAHEPTHFVVVMGQKPRQMPRVLQVLVNTVREHAVHEQKAPALVAPVVHQLGPQVAVQVVQRKQHSTR